MPQINRWQAPGNGRGFDSYLGNSSKMNNRTIGIMYYIKENSLVDGYVEEELFKDEIKEYLHKNFAAVSNDSLGTHFYKPALFYGFINRDKNYNLSLSIEGNLFLNSYKTKDFFKCKKIIINQLDNVTYPNQATPDVKGLKLFPFRILFKLLLEKRALSIEFIMKSLVYIVSLEDTKNIPTDKEYKKFYSWIISSLDAIEVLNVNGSIVSINGSIVEYIQSLYENLEYSDMFFEDISCDINKRVANKRVKRDASLIVKAKTRDNFKCMVDENHLTFFSKDKSYVEGHHLIPMYQQKNYTFKLDDVDNIISLCPNCHREIHFSDDKEEILKRVFSLHKDFMNAHSISLSDFYKMYSCV